VIDDLGRTVTLDLDGVSEDDFYVEKRLFRFGLMKWTRDYREWFVDRNLSWLPVLLGNLAIAGALARADEIGFRRGRTSGRNQ